MRSVPTKTFSAARLSVQSAVDRKQIEEIVVDVEHEIALKFQFDRKVQTWHDFECKTYVHKHFKQHNRKIYRSVFLSYPVS